MRNALVALAAIVAGAACGSSGFAGQETDTGERAASSDASSRGSSGGSSGATDIGGDASSRAPANDDGGGASEPTNTTKTTTTKETVQVAGHARTFLLVAPKAPPPGKSLPIVFVFHGDGGDGAWMHGAFPLETVGGDSAIFVYPDGTDATWDLYTPEASNEDAAFVDAMLASLKGRYSIDEARIFGSGYSSGAFFINQVACRRSGFFRAIAPNAGGAPQEPQDPAATYSSDGYVRCANQTTGVAALVMHGSADVVVGQTSGNYDAKYWATVNGCDPSEEARVATSPAPCVEHSGCPANARVVYCEIPGLGHVIWSESLKATWAFFMAQ